MHLLPEPRQRLGEGEGEVEDDGRRARHHRDGHGQVRRAHARPKRVVSDIVDTILKMRARSGLLDNRFSPFTMLI